MSEIDDMHQHFEALQAQVRDLQGVDNNSLLQEYRQEIDRLNEVIRRMEGNIPAKQLYGGGPSNENLLTNRNSMSGEGQAAEILISERGQNDQRRGNPALMTSLALSGFSANTAQPKLQINGSQNALASNRQLADM